ncbi:hypothetical protein ScPMuIL_017413 [Solemya velum]
MNDWELVTEAAVPDGSNDELSRDNNVSSADSIASSISEGLDNNIDSDATTSRSTEPSCSTPNYTNVRNSERSECPYCLLDPCVTSNRQKWLGRGQTARPSNSGIRKLRYQKFWKLLNKRGAWTKTAYLERKTQLMGNANPAIVWTYRDMMPECVLQCEHIGFVAVVCITANSTATTKRLKQCDGLKRAKSTSSKPIQESIGSAQRGLETLSPTSIPQRIQDPCDSPSPSGSGSETSLTDSGITEDGLNLHCLENVLQWQMKKLPQKESVFDYHWSKNSFCQQDHTGFEDYLDEIYFHRLGIEMKYHVIMCLDNQPEVTPGMRGLLVSWLTRLHHQLSLCQDTLFLAVNIVDRILDVMRVSLDCLQLLGVTSLLISSKQEEITPPEIKELLAGCYDNYTREQVKHLEKMVLVAIRFDLLAPTSQYFLEYFSSACLSGFAGFHADQLREARALARCALEVSLQDYELCQYAPSLLALCTWKVAVTSTNTFDGDYLPLGLEMTLEQFEACCDDVRTLIDKLQQSFPEMTSICGHYTSLYGKE